MNMEMFLADVIVSKPSTTYMTVLINVAIITDIPNSLKSVRQVFWARGGVDEKIMGKYRSGHLTRKSRNA